MNETVENLILAQLREIRAEMGEMRREVGEVRERIDLVEQKVDGVSLLLTTLAGYVHGIDQRVEALETRGA